MNGKKKLTLSLALELTAVLAIALCSYARAETVADGDQVMVRESDIARPHRGMTMQAVQAKFGAPATRHEAVGEPPISRWDYQGYSVFFEKDRVIHTVVDPAG